MATTLPWWVAGPVIGLVIVAFLALASARFGVVGGVTDLVNGVYGWRTLLLLGLVVGGAAYALVAAAPDAGTTYSWLDAQLGTGGEVVLLFSGGLLMGVGARTAGGCTSGHGLTGCALASPASFAAIATIMASAIGATFLLEAVI